MTNEDEAKGAAHSKGRADSSESNASAESAAPTNRWAVISVLRRNENLRRLWFGQALSQAGSRMYQIAIVWWLLSDAPPLRGGSGIWIGMILFISCLPALVGVQVIGRLIDRLPSRQILMRSDGVAALTAALLTAAMFGPTVVQISAVLSASLVLATCQALIDPTLNKSIPEVVPSTRAETDLPPAIALISSTQSLAYFMGAMLGATAVGWVGIRGAVAVNAISYALAWFCNSRTEFVRPAAAIEMAPAKSEELSTQSPPIPTSGRELLRQRPIFANILIGFGLLNFFGAPTLITLPIYVKSALNGNASLLAGLEAALWLGLLTGNLASSAIPTGKSTLKTGGICLFLFGTCLFIPGVWVHLAIYPVALAVGGYFLGAANIKFLSLFQAAVHPSIKGSFFSLLGALVSFTFPVAYLLFGFISGQVLPTTLCIVQGLGVMILALWFIRLSSRESEIWR